MHKVLYCRLQMCNDTGLLLHMCSMTLYTKYLRHCPVHLSVKNMHNRTSCRIQRRPIFALSFRIVRTSTTNLLVRGLGVEDQKNGLRGSSDLTPCVLFLWFWPKSKSNNQNQKHLIRWNNKFEILLPLFLFTAYGKVLSLSSM